MFLCCGDALFDMFVNDDSAAAGTLPATGTIALAGSAGGSPLNVGIGLSRLEHDSRYFTQFSTDIFGQRLKQHMRENGVDLALCPDSNRNTTLAIVDLDDSGAAQYAFYTQETADTSINSGQLPAKLPDAVRVLHFGSYSTAVKPSGDSLLRLAQRESAQRLISYDPNIRLTIEPDLDRWREMFSGFATAATLVKASDEDIAALFGPGGEERFVTAAMDAGASLVFVTLGPAGGRAYDRDGRVATARARPVSVVDTVGAGDTFQTTLLHWLASQGHVSAGRQLEGSVDLDACLALALRAAAITCSRRGADLPSLAELQGSV